MQLFCGVVPAVSVLLYDAEYFIIYIILYQFQIAAIIVKIYGHIKRIWYDLIEHTRKAMTQ